jgi:HlyD family secretion protein
LTARVEFMVDAAHDVLRVANAALRFQPEGQEDPGAAPGRSASGRARAAARLWTVDANGKLAAIPVRTGIANGVMTQVEGEGLSEGMRVVAGVRREEAGAPAAANPLQPSSGGRRGPGRPGGF